MPKLLLTLMATAIAIAAYAQRTAMVTAEYSYYAPENVSLEEAKRIALERARIQAIADEFGTVVSQNNTTVVANRNGETDSRFISFGGSDVKGEWIETIGEPEYTINYEQGMLEVACRVKGLIREIAMATYDTKVKLLRNGTDTRNESSDFHSGDDFYLWFKSPIDGYLAVYLVDAANTAFCLLPYRSQSDGIYRVAANQPYIFFSQATAPIAERSLVDEYVMTCDGIAETNLLYIIFSPNPFTKASDGGGGSLPRELDGDSFRQWVASARKQDLKMQLINKTLTITTEQL